MSRWVHTCALGASIGTLACSCRVGRLPALRSEEATAMAAAALPRGSEEPAGREALLEQGMPRIVLAVDDPRLVTARERSDAGDPGGAAREVERIIAGVRVDPRQACEFAYLAGRLHLAAGESAEAAADFERVASERKDADPACALSPYARLRETQALVQAGRFDQALASAEAAVKEGHLGAPIDDDVKLATADALTGTGDRLGAVPLWRELIEEKPRRARWVDLSIELATALLDGIDGPPAAHAQEALDRATHVLVDAPAAAD
ncbi:MAG: hypothetical protein ACREJ3_09910, partial [Polyangiaceae bacterium]